MKDFITAYLTAVSLLSLKIMLSLIAVDLLLGVILAIKNKEFNLQKLSDYLTTDVIPFIVYVALGFPAMLIPELATVLLAIGAGLIATETAMVLDKVSKLTGIPIPKVLVDPTKG